MPDAPNDEQLLAAGVPLEIVGAVPDPIDTDACTCDADGCDEFGEPGCHVCQQLDPEFPCPKEATDA